MIITLKYIGVTTTTREITVKDFVFRWIEVFWEEDDISIKGKKRNRHRGYQPILELQFEHDTQLTSVAKEIYDALLVGNVQYSGDEGEIAIAPEEYESVNDYLDQVQFQPATLVLEGNIQPDRIFFITAILCGFTDVFCGQVNVLCGG